jgi:hypothetical protein
MRALVRDSVTTRSSWGEGGWFHDDTMSKTRGGNKPKTLRETTFNTRG